KLQNAIAQLKRIYEQTVFPDMNVGWQTHPDNVGHSEFPGCFRCHDGKHVSSQQTAIRLECNICHSIPEMAGPGQPAPVIAIEKPSEPDSHLDTNWLARHRFEFDQTCATCHDVSNPGGSDNSSFCSNSACHASEWKYAGLDAPAIRKLSQPVKEAAVRTGVPPQVPHPIGPRTDCKLCHGLGKVRPYPENHIRFEPTLCTNCHSVIQTGLRPVSEAGPPPTPTPVTERVSGTPTPEPQAGAAPTISHTLEGRRDQCLTCHGESGFKPYPTDHVGRTTETCVTCHQPASPEKHAPSPTPMPAIVSFQANVLPIFQAKCSVCHGSVAGLDLTTYQGVITGGDSGSAVDVAQPSASLIFQKQITTHTDAARTLTEEEGEIILNWIAAGALDN
ncbi:MAG TPA: hypothetical protein EYH31_01735, partial [Anaerolineae bacterium]|nr:hypothetical protein [Anaerolineae bacterium]